MVSAKRCIQRACCLVLLLLLLAVPSQIQAHAQTDVLCPTQISQFLPTGVSIPDVAALKFNGQFLQRIDPATLQVDPNPHGVVGCYRYFSNNAGPDLLWDTGVVAFQNGDFYWVNAAGARWRMLQDFTNLRFSTDESNPYFKQSKYFYIIKPFSPQSGSGQSCRPINLSAGLGLGFPVPERAIGLTPTPKILEVLVDFREKIASSPQSEFARFELDKVSKYYKDTSFGKTDPSFVLYPKTIYLPGSVKDYQVANGNSAIISDALRVLKTQIDLRDYQGYLFASSENGPDITSGYADMVEGVTHDLADFGIAYIWMGAKSKSNITWVDIWKMVAHETGHMYGLPDLYMTTGSNLEGKTAGPFDLMDGITGKSNTFNVIDQWMLGWIKDEQILCRVAVSEPTTVSLSPLSVPDGMPKGLIIPISLSESLVVEARIASSYDQLLPVQEGVLVYELNTTKGSGTGPIRLIPANNEITTSSKVMDDVDRFIAGALQVNERVQFSDVFIELTRRFDQQFEVTFTRGNTIFAAADKAAADKAAADKAAADKAAKKSIYCLKGKVVKKINGQAKCPSGFKIKR